MLSLVAVVVVIGTVAQLNTILCEGTEPPQSPQIHPPSPQVSLNQRKFRAFILCLAWWWMVSGSAFSSLLSVIVDGWGLRKIRVHDEKKSNKSLLFFASVTLSNLNLLVFLVFFFSSSSVSQYLVTWIPINADWQLKMQEIRVGHYSANHHHPRCHLLTFVFWSELNNPQYRRRRRRCLSLGTEFNDDRWTAAAAAAEDCAGI